MSTPFSRHSSPAVQGTAALSANKESSARLTALGLADAFGEVLQCIPSSYRETLRPHLRELADVASKADGVRQSLNKLRRHKAESTWPPQLLGVHKPKFELTKQFAETNPDGVAVMDDAFAQFRSDALDSAIELKEAEQVYLDGLLQPQTYLANLLTILHHGYEMIKEKHQQPVFANAPGGEKHITGWKYSLIFQNEYDRLCEDLSAISSRLVLIERSKGQAEESKKIAKKNLKAQADVEMGDATTSSASISDIVQKELAIAMKKANISSVSTVLLSDSIFSHPLTARMLSASKEQKGEKEDRWPSQKGQDNGETRYPQKRLQTSPRTERSGPQRRFVSKRQREAEGLVASATNFRFDYPNSYPDAILNLPTPLAIRYVLRSASPAVLEASRFRADIHIGPGVFIPSRLSIHLSSGLKFMFPRYSDPSLLRDAYTDFSDRLRWRCYWLDHELQNGISPKPYDPDYEVARERSSCQYFEPYINEGLDAGLAFINNFISNASRAPNAFTNTSKLVEVSELLKYLEDNKLIVCPTDKNLGCSVITRQWFIERCENLLADTNNYELISLDERNSVLEQQCKITEELATFVLDHMNHPQLSSFLRSKVPDAGPEEAKIPVFYGIPKIHKKPVKMRPIVPCHSAIQNPAAKYVSKQLKPLLAEFPSLIKGSKDFATKLAQLKLKPGKKVFLVTADIVAFYPNVPLEWCCEIVSNIFLTRGFEPEKKTLAEKHMFSACLRLATRNLILNFMGKTYRQTKGLAMGVACSPDLANLYGCYFEEQILPLEDVPFFGRFIDDICAIVYANSAEEALHKCSSIKYDGVEIEWCASDRSLPFLDLLVYIDQGTGRIEHKPYRKARNHLERIPWASAHPKDVKKGTFIGEMSRLATLSSTHASYVEAISDLNQIYIARGYPPELIKLWLKDNTATRWQNRLGRTIESRDNAFVLKSHFNPVWNSFDVHELGHVVVNHWLDFLERQDDLNKIRQLPKSLPAESSHDPMDQSILGTGEVGPETSNEGETSLVNPPGAEYILVSKRVGAGGRHVEIKQALDIRKLDFPQRDWLVSRKRNRNLFDLVAKVKQNVLYVFTDPDIVMDGNVDNWD
jgi:hypothetical protein